MNRKILIILVTTAVLLYSYVAFMLAGGTLFALKDKTVEKKRVEISVDKLVLSAVPVKFEENKRDPFMMFEQKPSKQVAVVSKHIAKVTPKKEPPKPPSIKITGIMWNPGNPIAMVTMPDGVGIVAKNGMTAGNITFKKIEQNKILVLSEGKEFWINR